MRARDWVLVTILSLLAIICIRLGIWQLDRRQEKLSLNTWIETQLSQEPITIREEITSLMDWEYRKVEVDGIFQNEYSVVVRNRSYKDQPGIHLITPLQIENGGRAVLVDRGWISNESYIASGIKPYRDYEPTRLVGIIRLSQPEPSISFLADPTRQPGAPPLIEWRVLNVDRLQGQIPFEVYPFFLEIFEPTEDSSVMPIPNPEIDLSEGPHLSYAIQWFGFAGVALGGGYAWWRRRQPRKDENKDESSNL